MRARHVLRKEASFVREKKIKRVHFSDPLVEIGEAAPYEATWDLTRDEVEQGQIVAPNIFLCQ